MTRRRCTTKSRNGGALWTRRAFLKSLGPKPAPIRSAHHNGRASTFSARMETRHVGVIAQTVQVSLARTAIAMTLTLQSALALLGNRRQRRWARAGQTISPVEKGHAVPTV